MVKKFLKADENSAGQRLDLLLADKFPEISRSKWQGQIKAGQVLVNDRQEKVNFLVTAGDYLKITLPSKEEPVIEPQKIPLEIIYEDEDLLVVNKPQGMVVHPAIRNYKDTLVNALLYYCPELSGINGELRPGIVHRLDKDTSGLLVVAKNDASHLHLARQLQNHSLLRVYQAIIHGVMAEPAGVIEAPIGRHPVQRKKMAVVLKNSKEAVTHYRALERFKEYTYIEARLETGRTHQIRVHMSYLGYPLVGDPLYGPNKRKLGLKGQALHASVIGFTHPRRGGRLKFEAPLPDYFQDLLGFLGKRSD